MGVRLRTEVFYSRPIKVRVQQQYAQANQRPPRMPPTQINTVATTTTVTITPRLRRHHHQHNTTATFATSTTDL